MRDKPFSFIWQDSAGLFVVALIVRLVTAWPQRQPSYFDAAAYYMSALNFLRGRGFVDDFIWNYLANPGPPPQPSFLYWMPLASIAAWLGMVVGGPSYRAAQVPFIVLSAVLSLVTFWIAYLLSGQRWLSWLAALFTIFSGLYFSFWTAIDNFALIGITVSLAFVFAWKGTMFGVQSSGFRVNSEPGTLNPEQSEQGSRGVGESRERLHPGWIFLSGIFAGLAHLSRAEGFLVLMTLIPVYFFQELWASRQLSPHPLGAGGHQAGVSRLTSHLLPLTFHVLRFTFFLLLGYLIIMTPWFIRNWQVAGTPLASSGAKTMWVIEYEDAFSYKREVSARAFFAQGLDGVLQGRWRTFLSVAQILLITLGMGFLFPLALIGGWQLRRHRLVQMVGVYTLLLTLFMGIIFGVVVERAGFFHAGPSLLPFMYALAMVGLDRSVDWLAARRPHWNAYRVKQVLGLELLILAIGLSSYMYYVQVLRNDAWNQVNAVYPTIVAWVKEQDPRAVVMIGNPPAYSYFGGGLSAMVTNEDVEVTLEAIRHYGVDYLVLDRNHPIPLTELYHNPALHPALQLVKSYDDSHGSKIYVFEVKE